MRDYVIIPDSSCDLTADLRERFGIEDYLQSVVYFPDGRAVSADLDWGCISPEEYYGSMKDRKIIYKTASVPVGNIYTVFEKYLNQGKDILSISLSSALSTSFGSCQMVAKELLEKYPERKIICIDSLRYSTSLALLTVMGCKKKEDGASIEEVAEYLNETRHCIHQMGPMDDLFFLVKMRRISNFKALFGTLVGINPMADFNRDGLSEVLVKFKGKRAALSATLSYMEQTGINLKDQIVFISHSNRYEVACQLKTMIEERFSPKEIIISTVGMACGAAIGPGLCAVYYYGKPISENLAEEKEIMATVSENMKTK